MLGITSRALPPTAIHQRGWSGQGQEELFQVFPVHACVLLGNALLQTRGNDGEPCPVEGFGHGGELGDDIPAVPPLLQHAGDSGELTLGALEPIDHRREF